MFARAFALQASGDAQQAAADQESARALRQLKPNAVEMTNRSARSEPFRKDFVARKAVFYSFNVWHP